MSHWRCKEDTWASGIIGATVLVCMLGAYFGIPHELWGAVWAAFLDDLRGML